MLIRCIQCHGVFYEKESDSKAEPYLPPVCGQECFVALLSSLPSQRMQMHLLPHLPSVVNKDAQADSSPFLKFRSSYEASLSKWMLKAISFGWWYEPYVFTLPSKKKYIPDFYLPTANIFLEVKGLWEKSAYAKVKEFDKHAHRFYVITKDFMRRMKIPIRKELP